MTIKVDKYGIQNHNLYHFMDIKLINYDIQNHNLYHFIGIKVDKLGYSDTQFITLLSWFQTM